MADREKLIDLLDDIQRCGEDYTDYEIYGMRLPDTVSNEEVASHLIANGVTVRESGRWIEVDDGVLIGQGKHYECSKCGTWTTPWRLSDFCPNCGADMR